MKRKFCLMAIQAAVIANFGIKKNSFINVRK
jgi:hypothetical protein